MKTENDPTIPSLSRGAMLALWGISAVVFGYCLSRAIQLSLTHDEALTYVDHARATLPQIFRFDIRVPSNNHLLNTLLIKVLVAVFGDAEVVLRAPALAGLAMFLIGSARVLVRYVAGIRSVVGFALVASNAYLLDFFGCARGYGLALGFGSLALAGFLERVTGKAAARRAGAWSIVFAGLAVFSNLAFATLFVAFASALTFVELRESKRRGVWRLPTLPVILAIGGLLAIVFRPSVLERIQGPLEKWGGDTGVWTDTISSVVANGLYFLAANPAPEIQTVRWVVLVVAIGATLFATAAWLRLGGRGVASAGDDLTGRALLAIVSLVTLLVVGIHLQVRFFQMPFPIGRGVIYLIPLFSIGFLLVWQRGAEISNTAVRCSIHAACAIVIAALLFLQLAGWNRTHTLHWRYDADTRAAMAELARMSAPSVSSKGDGDHRSLGVHWAFEPSANYYRIRGAMTWLRPIDRETVLADSHDYYLLRSRKQVEAMELTLVRRYEISGACLAKP